METSAQAVVEALQALRDKCTTAQWDRHCDGPLGELISACLDLEADIESEG